MNARRLHRSSTLIFSVAMLLLGLALVVQTLARGGGPLTARLIIGVLFVAAGAGRLYALRHQDRR